MLYPDIAIAFQERVRSKQVCFGVHHSAMSPQLVELYGHIGMDFIVIGNEVESLDRGRMEDLLRAADVTRTLPIVKVRHPSPEVIGEVTDAGCPLVMVPHVTNRAQLDAMVRASRFAPDGLRGVCPVARYNGFGSKYLEDARQHVKDVRCIVPIIEDVEALDHLDELMSCPDVDMFEVGPFDLAASFGDRGKAYDSPKVMAAIDKISEFAHKYDKAIMAPLSFSLRRGTVKDILQWQMDELISRGITVLWASEMGLLVDVVLNLSVIRKVRIEDDAEESASDEQDATADAPIAAQS